MRIMPYGEVCTTRVVYDFGYLDGWQEFYYLGDKQFIKKEDYMAALHEELEKKERWGREKNTHHIGLACLTAVLSDEQLEACEVLRERGWVDGPWMESKNHSTLTKLWYLVLQG